MDIVCYLDKKGITILACFPVHRSKNDRVYANNTMPVSKPKKYVYLGLFPVVFEFYNSDLIHELTLGQWASPFVLVPVPLVSDPNIHCISKRNTSSGLSGI